MLFIKKTLLCKFAFVVLFNHSAFAKDTPFRKVQLAYGISLDIPSHWKVMPKDHRKNVQAAGQAIANAAGIDEGLNDLKESLLSVHAVPSPTGAMIRVSVTSPPDYSQADLAAVTPADLKELGTIMQGMSGKIEASGGPKIIERQPIRIEKLNNYQVLVIPYIRASANGPSHWQVIEYDIPVSNRLIQITFSYRQSDGVLWRPILELVKRSVKF